MIGIGNRSIYTFDIFGYYKSIRDILGMSFMYMVFVENLYKDMQDKKCQFAMDCKGRELGFVVETVFIEVARHQQVEF